MEDTVKFGEHDIPAPIVEDPTYVRYQTRYDNGYGASIISFGLHGNEVGEHWEVAVIKWTEGFWCMDETVDVIPGLSGIEVGRVLDHIKSLPKIIDGEVIVKEIGS
jgi:hypothetical protein